MATTPSARAQQLVAGIKPDWGRITKGDINLRRQLLEVLCLDEVLLGGSTLKPGVPGLYLFACAGNGDQTAYDLLIALGADLNCVRPKAPGGKDANAARDFMVDLLSTVLMIEYPELFQGANNATEEGTSAVDMIRKAIEDAGLGCIDYRAAVTDAPVPRSMERAVRRFRNKSKYRELFWPVFDEEEESCHTPSGAVLGSGVCTETSSDGGANDRTGTIALGCAAHDLVSLLPVCPDESRKIP